MAEIKLQIIEGPNAGQDLEVEGAAVIGRDPGSAALVVDDREASRRHASLIPEGQSLNVEDLGSTNGTFVNGERLVGARVLVPGDRLRIGTTVLEVRIATAIGHREAARRAASGPPAPAAPEATVQSAPPFAGVSGGSPEQPPAGGPPPPPPPPAGDPPPAAPPPAPTYPPVASGGSSYPIDFQADYPEAGIARWRAFFQGLLLIPHLIVLLFVYIGAFFAWIGAFFAILITGKYPEGIFNFLAGTLHWGNRYTGYQYWFTEQYPPFSLGPEPEYPVRTRIDYPPDGKIARWRPLFQGLLAIPHFVIVSFLFLAEYIVVVVAFFSILFTRQWPRGMFDFTVGIIRWRTRVNAYGYLWMTEEYPPFTLD